MSSANEKPKKRKSPGVGRKKVVRGTRAKGKPFRPLDSSDLSEAIAYLLRLAVEWEGLDEETPKGTGLPKRLNTQAMLKSVMNQLLNHREDRRAYAAQVQVTELVQPTVEYASEYARATAKGDSHEAASILARAADDLGNKMFGFRLPIPGKPSLSYQDQRRFWVTKAREILQATHHKKGLRGSTPAPLRKRVLTRLANLVGASATTLQNHAAARSVAGKKSGAIKSEAELVGLRDGLGPDLGPRLRYLLTAEGLAPNLVEAMVAAMDAVLGDAVRNSGAS